MESDLLQKLEDKTITKEATFQKSKTKLRSYP